MTEAWMTMIFRHGFFHADPHPANILVLGRDRIGLVDFGQAGTLSDDDMSKGTRLFIDIANENIDAIPRRLAELGVDFPREMEDQFRVELRELFFRYYGASLSEIDPLQVIREVFALIYSLQLHLPTRFVMLDKAIGTLASVTQELYPDFNVFEVAKPYARSLLLGRYTPRRVVGRLRRETTELVHIGRELPYQVHDVLEELRDGSIEVGFVHKNLEVLTTRVDVAVNRLVVALVVMAGLIGSSLIGIFADSGPHVLGLHVLSVLGFVASGLLGVWLLVAIFRSGRL
jgi:ubiquinone biosynthesis protein